MNMAVSGVYRILACVAALLFGYWQPTVALSAVMLWCLWRLIGRSALPNDRRYLRALILLAIGVKLVVLVLYTQFWLMKGHRDIIGPDGEGFSQRGWYISRVLSGAPDYSVPSQEHVFVKYYRVVDYYKQKLPPFNSRANRINTYAIGIVYYLFGYVPLFVKFTNIIIAAVSTLVFYRLCLESCDRATARAGALLFAWFPTLFVFSITALREPLFILAVVYFFRCMLKYRGNAGRADFAGMAVSLTVLLFLREEYFVFLAIISIAFAIIALRSWSRWVAVLFLCLVTIVAASLPVFKVIMMKPEMKWANVPAMVFARHAGLYAEGGRLAYTVFPERDHRVYAQARNEKEYYADRRKIGWGELVRSMPSGIVSYLARPYPIKYATVVDAIMSVQMVVWYAVLALALYGMTRPARGGGWIIAFTVSVILTTCLVDANEGILLRHRDTITPFVIFFASNAVSGLRPTRRGVR